MLRNTSLSTAPVLSTRGPFADPDYTAEIGPQELASAKVLVVGAGGLGCEILKDLVLSSFTDIEVIDMDTIELSNLNRQFLFRQGDVGKSKAEVAARSVCRVVKGAKITPHFNKIQDFDDDFYRRFTLVVCGLDNVAARSWLNKTIVDIAFRFGQYIPLIDGGTEGFQGSVKVMVPTVTACFECYKMLLPKQTTYPLCTLASTPRLPEHCIEWAHQLRWPQLYPDTKFDADIPDHVDKMYALSLERAKKFGIQGVTKFKTLGVVKNIIPAIASTNAVIAASCCNEAFKFVTSCNPGLPDSMYYNGEAGVVLASDEFHKLPDCPVCGISVEQVLIEDATTTVSQFAHAYVKDKYALNEPDIFYSSVDLYNFKNPDGEGDKKLVDAVPFEQDEDGNLKAEYQIMVVDSTLKEPLRLEVTVAQ